MKKINIISFIFLFIILFFVSCKNESASGEIVSFKSRNELVDYLGQSKNNYNYNSDSAIMENDAAEKAIDYTTTNTQEKNIDEGDVIKTDGNYIYFLSYNGLKIIKISNGNMELVYEEKYEDYVPIEMYISEEKIIVIGSLYSQVAYLGIGLDFCDMFITNKTDIRIYDFTNITKPVLKQKLIIDGNYQTSRISNNNFYYFINSYSYFDTKENFKLPTISNSLKDSGKSLEINATKINYLKNQNSYSISFLIIGKLNLNNQKHEYEVYLNAITDVYVSEEYIYLYFNVYYSDNQNWTQDTVILKISINNLKHEANVKVNGYINNRYSLDEYNGYLRVVTTVTNWSVNTNEIYNTLYIFDSTLKQTGYIGNIARGERVFAVRFNDATGSIVTFKQIDPLFKLDLSNPYEPKISDGLKEEGVSLYLHYIEGTNYSIGIGRNAEALGDDLVTWQGLKVTLYDNSGAEAVAVKTITIGNSVSYAEVLYNPKALLYDHNRNIFAFAAEEWNTNSKTDYYTYKLANQGLYVFSFENDTLEIKAILSNFSSNLNYENWYDYYDNYYSYVKRSTRIGDYIYTISEKYVCSYSLNNYELMQKMQINEFPSIKDLYEGNK